MSLMRQRDSVKSLAEMAEEIYEFEKAKGWQPNDNTFGDSLALLHSEISEALEAFREIKFERRDTPVCKQDEYGHDWVLQKPDDVASELADVLIRLLSTWHQFLPEFDLAEEFERKMEYNYTRSWRHGGKSL